MIFYNGHEFSKRSLVEIQMDMIYDEANRVVVGRQYLITVKSIVLPDCTVVGDDLLPGQVEGNTAIRSINNTMDDIRQRLSESGKMLQIGNVGFGRELTINPDSPGITEGQVTRDIRSGPKPKVLRWLPIGHESAAEIVWQVETIVSPCDDDEDDGLMSMNYGISFSINRSGFTTKQVQGHLTVAQHKTRDGLSTSSADDYRDRIEIQRLANSHREQSYTLSPDKSRLDFSITDTEIESPNSYPEGVVSISAPTRSRIMYPNPGSVTTQNDFSLQLKLEPKTARIRAWEIFQSLFETRIQEFVDADIQVIITDLEIEEDWFTHDYSFSVKYRITTDFVTFLQNSAYFRAYPVTWTLWQDAIEDAQSSRGIGQMKHERDTDNDLLTSLCDQTKTNVAAQATPYFRDVRSIGNMCNEAVPKNKSWLLFDAELIEQTEVQKVHHTTYGEVKVSQNDFDISGNEAKTTLEIDMMNVKQSTSQAPPIQKWVWKGRAHRITHPIPPIGKIKIGNQDADITGEPKITCRQIGTLFCQPVYECIWSIGLITLNSPGDTITNDEIDPTGTTNDNSISEEGA